MRGLVASLSALGRFEEAEPLAREYYERQSKVVGPDDRKTREAIELLAELYDAWEKPARADDCRAELLHGPTGGSDP
jgi:hypothetical protein